MMKRSYSKWGSIALIAAIYVLAGIIGWLVFHYVMQFLPSLEGRAWVGLFLADVVATVVVWAFGLLYENVSVYDPYWSVFPPVVFLLWAFYTGVWSLPVILLLVASWYWGWRLTRNWAITFKGIAHEDWRYTKYRSLHPDLFHPRKKRRLLRREAVFHHHGKDGGRSPLYNRSALVSS